MSEEPRPQQGLPERWREVAGVYSNLLMKYPWFSDAKVAVDLGCGKGYWEEQLVEKLPKLEKIIAIDYHRQMPDQLASDPKIIFHQGRLPKALEFIPKEDVDLVIIANLGEKVFQTFEHYEKLRDVVGNGKLILLGDNRGIEKHPSFPLLFEEVPLNIWKLSSFSVWQAKNEVKF